MIQINQTLYKQTKTGAIQQWSVFVDGSTITVEQGQVGGALQQYQTVCEAKNVGKANETTPEEQSVLEANSKWSKQVKKGYTTDKSGSVTVKLPMKVKVYQDNIPNVIFPCYVSPKLDGVNGTFILREDGELELRSRGGELYNPLEHLHDEIRECMSLANTNVLNGEVYIHGQHLQDIQSAVKKENGLTSKLEFHIFEYPEIDLPWKDKQQLHQKLLERTNAKSNVRVIFTYTVNSFDEIDELFDTIVSKCGYEGLIIRNARCKYEYNKRSSDVFKYKKAQDAEFKITGYQLDKNKQTVFTCITQEGEEFKVKCKGDNKLRSIITRNAESWIGEWLKVEYEQLSKSGIPLKPVGIWIRDVDSKGNVKE